MQDAAAKIVAAIGVARHRLPRNPVSNWRTPLNSRSTMLDRLFASHGGGRLRGDTSNSHTVVFDLPRYPRMPTLADCVVDLAPDLQAKQDILGHAVRLRQAVGIGHCKVGIVAGFETVNPAIPGTLDAQALEAMSRDGGFTGAIVEGRSGFENAISAPVSRIKTIDPQIPSDVDLLLVPGLSVGDMLYKSFV